MTCEVKQFLFVMALKKLGRPPIFESYLVTERADFHWQNVEVYQSRQTLQHKTRRITVKIFTINSHCRERKETHNRRYRESFYHLSLTILSSILLQNYRSLKLLLFSHDIYLSFTSFVELWFLFLNFHNWKSRSSESGLLQPGNHLIIYFRSKTYCLFFYRLVLQKKLISCRKAIQLKSTVYLTTKKKRWCTEKH